ncbi:hypothetical protein MMF93_29415 [Streptomyces tubbatahanensis]|uniref:Mce-associated membrane protein n=1 Tax=Streptomyces tubbatahanensis TaxID=2923272 RepID=A0ABY3Y0I5_9ACTN|nr:hypothetical protein [Streptomyces tubbatahanensis]UNT00117.1 hypothetical protein MMF93_29415 [Streptomyces tubbatahanensis]
MSTTRHLVNRQRRLADRPRTGRAPQPDRPDPTDPTDPTPGPEPRVDDSGGGKRRDTTSRDIEPPADAESATDVESATDARGRRTPGPMALVARLARLVRGRAPRGRGLPLVCAVLTLLLGGFAAWAATEAAGLRDAASARNTALADAAGTSRVKGEVTSAVNALFSYDHAKPGKNEDAARRLLTGKAVEQHRELLATVRKQGREQKLVLTTTVTDSAVTALEGDRARVLLFADQHSARTGARGEHKAKADEKKADEKKADGGAGDDATYAGAMLAVNAVRQDGTWKIAAIDTLS